MKSKRIGTLALTGVLSALAVVCLLLTATPLATIGTVALAAVCGIPVVTETGRRGGLLHFAAVAVLAWLLVPEMEAKVLYTGFLGWYTVFKAWLEQKDLPRPAEWGIKYGVFAAAIAVFGVVRVFLLRMPLPPWSWVMPAIAVAVCILFAVYDRCLTGLVGMYIARMQPTLRRLFKF